jgi:hypothetical protein
MVNPSGERAFAHIIFPRITVPRLVTFNVSQFAEEDAKNCD